MKGDSQAASKVAATDHFDLRGQVANVLGKTSVIGTGASLNGEAIKVATNQTDAQVPIAEKVVRVAEISSFMPGVELGICEPRMVGVTTVSVGNPTMITIRWWQDAPAKRDSAISLYNWTARRNGIGNGSRSVFGLEQQAYQFLEHTFIWLSFSPPVAVATRRTD